MHGVRALPSAEQFEDISRLRSAMRLGYLLFGALHAPGTTEDIFI